MALVKRATAELAQHGLTDIEVHKGLWGYYATNRTYRKQTGTPCRDSAALVVADVLAGKLPKNEDAEVPV